jgi:hypothetical protein
VNTTRYDKLISAFQEAVREALVENWDGHGAHSVSWAAAQAASTFIMLLPTAFPVPEFSVDPDGEVSLDWIRERDWLLSVSVGANGTIAYAGRFGLARQSGSEAFIDDLPPNVLSCLRRLYAP